MRQDKKEDSPFISIVIIGHNEVRNLPACIQSVREVDYPLEKLEVIFINSNSTDGSPELARSLGLKVYEELGGLQSAARARNRGLREAKHRIIHFLDGDMTIAPSYLRQAVQRLGHEGIVSVFGRIKERRFHKNWISKVLAADWAVKQPGFVDSPGAGGTFLKPVLEEVGGYNANLIVAEETDLGIRLRDKGYRILFINELMGEHDYGVEDLISLLSRFFLLGKNFGRLLFVPGSTKMRIIKKPGFKLLIQGSVGLMAVFILLISGHWIWSVFLVFAAYILLIPYVLLRYKKQIIRKQLGLPVYGYYYLAYAMKPLMFTGLLWSLIQKIIKKL